jgi:hypothetical protein
MPYVWYFCGMPTSTPPDQQAPGSVPPMSPKLYEGPSSYGPDNEAARKRAWSGRPDDDLEPMRIVDIAEWLDVRPNTISRGWIADRDTIKDPDKKFPEPTWPEKGIWAKGVVRKWARNTDRLPEGEE